MNVKRCVNGIFQSVPMAYRRRQNPLLLQKRETIGNNLKRFTTFHETIQNHYHTIRI